MKGVKKRRLGLDRFNEGQVPRDRSGKKRFHGAFSGGFSAGYHNTVGSAEGWSPAPFMSSRNCGNGAHNVVQRAPNYYMDEEDEANINIWNTGSEVWAGCEQLTTTTFDIKTLATIGHTNYTTMEAQTNAAPTATATETGMLPSMSGAHPSRIVGSNDTLRWSGKFSMIPGQKPVVSILRDSYDVTSGQLSRRVIGKAEFSWMPMMHSLSVTRLG